MGAGDSIREYNKTAASNTSVGGINLSEGVMVPSDLNNSHRELMSHLAALADGTDGIDVLSLVDDDASAAIKLQAPATVTTTTTFTLPDGDGTNGQVLNTDGAGQLGWSSAFSSGMLVPFAGASAPGGWLLCYGQAVSRTTYAALFSAIGTTYGSGDGSTTFNVPDLRGRVIAGQDDMGGTSADRLTDQTDGIDGDTLGATGGAETHTLTEAQLAAHRHLMFKDGAGNLDGNHNLDSSSQVLAQNNSFGSGDEKYALVRSSDEADVGRTNSVGSDEAHNNVQPTIVLNYIIKT
tara:strand:- start:478 stop:1356 length:879 start_codon:yes stop_codon:yes gene_type:complete